MNVIAIFLVGATAALTLSLLTVAVLRPHLGKLLVELCGSAARAGFWRVAFCLSIFFVGLLAGTVSTGYPDYFDAPRASEQAFFGLVTQLRACLSGLLISIMASAWLLLGMIRRFEQSGPPPPRNGRLTPGAQLETVGAA